VQEQEHAGGDEHEDRNGRAQPAKDEG